MQTYSAAEQRLVRWRLDSPLLKHSGTPTAPPMERKLQKAQQGRKKRQAKGIHAKD